jgi:hypothetical protein
LKTITREHAQKIADKLDCRLSEGKAHTTAEVWEGEILVARFGIRRGSKELGHDHLPSELHLKRKECKELYECTLDRPAYIRLMRERDEFPPRPTERA